MYTILNIKNLYKILYEMLSCFEAPNLSDRSNYLTIPRQSAAILKAFHNKYILFTFFSHRVIMKCIVNVIKWNECRRKKLGIIKLWKNFKSRLEKLKGTLFSWGKKGKFPSNDSYLYILCAKVNTNYNYAFEISAIPNKKRVSAWTLE